MARLIPVEGDPFASSESSSGPRLVPVDFDPMDVAGHVERQRRAGRLPPPDPRDVAAEERRQAGIRRRQEEEEIARQNRAYLDEQNRQPGADELLDQGTNVPERRRSAGERLLMTPTTEMEEAVEGLGADPRDLDPARVDRSTTRPLIPEARGQGAVPEGMAAFDRAGDKFRENLDDRVGRVVGGLIQALPEMSYQLDPGRAMQREIMEATLRRQGMSQEAIDRYLDGPITEAIQRFGRGIFDRASREIERNDPGVTGVARYSYDLLNAFADLGMAVGVAGITKSPTLGASVTGVQVFGDRYGESIRQGRTEEQAMMDASFYGAAEAIGERVVVGRLLRNAGDRILGRVVNGAVSEGIQETLTEGLQTAYDAGIIGEEMTLRQAVDRMAYAGLLGAGAGGGIGAVTRTGVSENAGTVEITPDDEASALPTEIIAEGKSVIDQLLAEQSADDILNEEAGIGYGDRVTISLDDIARTGTVKDAFVEEDDELGPQRGAVIEWDDGTEARERFSDLRDSGARIERERIPEVRPARPNANQRLEGSARQIVKARIAQAESGGDDNARNPRSSASGRYQFIDETFNTYFRRVYRRDPTPADRNNVEVQERLMDALLTDNERALRRGGHAVTPGNLYLSHFLGSGGANTVLRNPNAPIEQLVGQGVVNANPFLRGMTGADVVRWAEGRMGGQVEAGQQPSYEDGTPVDPVEPNYAWMENDVRDEDSDFADFDETPGAAQESPVIPASEAGEDVWSDWRSDDTNRPEIDGFRYAMAMVANKDPDLDWMPEYQRGAQDGAGDMRDPASRDTNYLSGFWRARNRYPHGGAEPDLSAAPEQRATLTDAQMADITKAAKGFSPRTSERQWFTDGAREAMGVYTIPEGTSSNMTERVRAAVEAGRSYALSINGDGTRSAPIDVRTSEDVDRAATQTAEPTEAQKEAGNYKKGHVRLQGLDITIETPRGATRSGTDPDGNAWSVEMPDHYGYVKRTTGGDGEQVDVYIGQQPDAGTVFVIDQNDADTGKFDEHKAMVGYPDEAAARTAYEAAFSDGRGAERIGAITPMPVEQFKTWLAQPQPGPAAQSGITAPRQQARARGPQDAIAFIKGLGGVRNDEGHDLIHGRNWNKARPGLIRRAGRSIDEIGEALFDAGYFPNAKVRPTTDAVLEFVERALRKRTFRLEDEAAVAESEAARAKVMDDQEERDRITDLASTSGLAIDDADIARAMEYRADGFSQEAALDAAMRDAAAEVLEAGPGDEYATVAEGLYEGEIAEARGDDQGAAEAVARSEGVEGDPAAGRDADAQPNGARQKVSTAPEHAQVGVDQRELSEIVVSFDEVRASQGVGEEQITHIFDPPTKGEIVKLNDKAKVYHRDHGWMTIAEARAKIEEWKAHAEEQGENADTRRINSNLIVLSFFDYTGAWSQPWEEAGYQVWRFDIQNDPEMGDVTKFSSEFFADWFGDFDGLDIYAILAACPCTDFASSGARHFAAKDADGRTVASVRLVQQTLAAIEYFKPAVWAVENPVGRIEKLGGLPPWRLSFDPNSLGDPYTKKTLLWGRFNADLPIAPVEPTEGSKMWSQYGGKSLATKNARSATPEGFSYGFFMANNAVDHPAMAIANKFDRLDRALIEQAVAAGVTEAQITEAVEDFYYQELDDDAANAAIRELVTNAGSETDQTPDMERDLLGNPVAQAKPKPTKEPEDETPDMFGEREGDKRRALERQGEGRKKSDKKQKAAGEDGGLFDVRDTTRDIEEVTQPESGNQVDSSPVEQAKAALQNALDLLNGTTPTKIEDVGEKIGGARKDLWAERGMNLSDLEGMSQGEAFQLVTKDAVWPKPDYAKLVESGVQPAIAARIKLLRDSLAAKPRTDSEKGRRDYVEMMGAARLILESVRNPEDIRGIQARLYAAAGDMGGGLSRTPEQKANQQKLFSIFKGRTAKFSVDYAMGRKADQMAADGFPEKVEPWKRRFAVIQRGGQFIIIGKSNRRMVLDGFLSQETAEQAAKTYYEGLESGRSKQPERPHLDNIKRTGADVRGDRDVKAEDFLTDFGFRGIEFGNWLASDERQTSVNLAYEALHDLANVLGIPPRALSLGGQLGLAFGARGSGRAAAHYEPGKLVINLTKMSGAGTLAHEWGHALDHYFGTLDTDAGTRGAPVYASGGREFREINRSRLVALPNLRPEMAKAFDDLMTAIFKRDLTRAEMVRNTELSIEKTQAGIQQQRDRITRMEEVNANGSPLAKRETAKFVKQSEEWIAQRERILTMQVNRLAELKDESKPVEPMKVNSSYYDRASKLGKGADNYWTRPTEMLARSFEAYMLDRIKAGGNVSQYLVQGVEESSLFAQMAYPLKEERQAINAAYDALFATMDVRQSDGEEMLFQRRLTEGDDPVFYSALERAIEANPTQRASAAQWTATLSKTPGVKKEELEWSGLFDWLDAQQGPVGRDDLLAVVRDGGIKVEEIVLGDPGKTGERPRAEDYEESYEYEEDRDAWIAMQQETGTQFNDWTSDRSNEGYRELLITLPVATGGNPERAPATHWDQEAVVAHTRFMPKTDADGKRVLFIEEVQSDWHQKGRDEGYETTLSAEEMARRDTERDEAETAFNEARDTLFVEADRIRNLAIAKGKKRLGRESYLSPTAERSAIGPLLDYQRIERAKNIINGLAPIIMEDRAAGIAAIQNLEAARLRLNEATQAASRRNVGFIPDAPFKASWPALVMKRVIRWAVDNGYERVAWTTGAQQNERYSLEKFIDRVTLTVTSGGIGDADMGPFTSGMFYAYDQRGRETMSKYVTQASDLYDVIGKELADKLVAAPPRRSRVAGMGAAIRELSGLDLRTGGEGMRGFYDRNLVNIANDLIKKHGGKVGTVEIINTSSGFSSTLESAKAMAEREGLPWPPQRTKAEVAAELDALIARGETNSPQYARLSREYDILDAHENFIGKQPGFTITPALADAARSGFPLFAREAIRARPVTDEEAAEIVTRLQAELDRLGISDRIALKAANGIFEGMKGSDGIQGGYFRRVISVALDQAINPMATMNHEAIHAMRALNLFTDSEWTALKKAAWATPGIKEFVNRGYSMLPDMKRDEEAVAEYFARWRTDRQAPGLMNKALNRVTDFLHALSRAVSWVMGRRAPLSETILRGIESGRVGRRETGAGTREEAPMLQQGGFWTWFGDSKVVDENGVPKPVYHGTAESFDAFSGNNFFSDDRAVAERFRDGVSATYGDGRKGRVISAYLRIERPLEIDAKGDFAANVQFGKARKAWEEALADERYDGIIIRNTRDEGTIYVPKRPNQIKSTANSGTFDSDDDRMMFQRRTPASVWNDMLNRTRDLTGALKTPGKREAIADAFDRLRTNMQDRMLPMLKAQTAIEQVIGRQLREDEQPYRQEALYTGRVGAQLEALEDEHLNPLMEAMQQESVTLDELESYLYARHAPERNAKLKAEGVIDGSGMSDIEAKAIMTRVEKSGKKDAIEALAARVDSLIAFALDTRQDAGLISKEDVAEWRSRWKHYVPLRGVTEMAEDERPMVGKGFTVKGPESKRAFGRKSKAEDILAHVIMQAEEAIVRAEKNRVAVELYNLAKANPDENFWKIAKVQTKKRVNKETGQIETYIVTKHAPEDELFTVSAKIGGKGKRVTFNKNNRAARNTAAAMRRINEPELNIRTLQVINQWLSKANTTLNPDFIFRNAFRDLETALANLSGFDIKGMRRDTVRDYRKALMAAERGAFKRQKDTDWDRAWTEFTNEGGRVFYNQVQDVEELRKGLEQRFAKLNHRRTMTPKQWGMDLWNGLKWTFDKIDKANLGVENAVRLSVYKNLRDRGISAKQSAFIAKELTVNFNRRGVYGVLMNSLFLFYNASVQGNARMIMALKHRRTQKIAASMVIAGALNTVWNVLASGVDDDDELVYDKISDHEKSTNLIFMIPGTDRYIKIPVAYGYNVFPELGRHLVDVVRGRESPMEGAGDWLMTALNSFNPIGGNEALANFVAPTVLDPLVDLQIDNRDYADRPIMPDQPQYGPPVPDNQRFWPSVFPGFRAITDAMNEGTGGDRVVPGWVDVSPETLEYMAQYVTGAAGSTIMRMGGGAMKVFDGDPATQLEINDVPMARTMVGRKPSWYDRAAFYERLDHVEQTVARARDYRENRDREGFRAFREDQRDVLAMKAAARQASREMRRIRSQRAQLDLAADLDRITDEVRMRRRAALKEREEMVFTRFNRMYLRTVEEPRHPAN